MGLMFVPVVLRRYQETTVVLNSIYFALSSLKIENAYRAGVVHREVDVSITPKGVSLIPCRCEKYGVGKAVTQMCLTHRTSSDIGIQNHLESSECGVGGLCVMLF